MITSLISLLFLGIFAGIIFSVPIAGPIAILVVTNSLQKKIRFVTRIALGSSVVEFLYVFIAMFGITNFLKYYDFLIPYLFIFGGLLIIFISIRLFRTKIEMKKFDEEKITFDEQKGGFRTGIMVNLTNPTLFFGWLTSSFLLLTFASSIGLNTGGIEKIIGKNIDTLNYYTHESINKVSPQINQIEFSESEDDENLPTRKTLVLSLTFSFGVAIGGFIWFVFLSRLLVQFIHKIKMNYLNNFIKTLSMFLVGISVYFMYLGIRFFIK